MNYPFTAEQFIGVITKYNVGVWPFQILFYIAAAAAIFFVFRHSNYSSKIISAILAGFWLWMGIVYHWYFFTDINPAAKIFGAFFVIEGLLFAYLGALKNKLEFGFDKSNSSYLGMGLVATGLLIYPIIGYFMDHIYPDNPTFGLPCPTTIFTLGLILLSRGSLKRLIIIPFLWSLLGFMAAISFGIKEDVLLLISGIVTAIFVFFRKPVDKAVQSQVVI